MRRAKRPPPPDRLLVRPQGADQWLVTGEALLDLLRRRMPRRWPPHWKRCRLDCRSLPLDQGLPAGLHCGELNLAGTAIRALPAGLRVSGTLDLSGCKHLPALPPGLRVGLLDVRGCTALEALPRDLCCGEVDAEGAGLRCLPADLRVGHRLSLANCRSLGALPAGLRVRLLVLRGCTALEALPPGLDAFDLDLTGCTALRAWPGPARVRGGRLRLAGCARLTALPPGLGDLELLDVRDCPRLTELPDGLRVCDWLDVGSSGLTGLPASLRGARLLWHGVEIDERTAFRPDELTPDEVLHEPNAERRRVMLERYGFERLLRAPAARLLDADRDAGGRRELLCLPLGDDEEPLVCVAVVCPSTGRRYLLRVPPTVRTCREAVAWTAGFDDPAEYRPVQET